MRGGEELKTRNTSSSNNRYAANLGLTSNRYIEPDISMFIGPNLLHGNIITREQLMLRILTMVFIQFIRAELSNYYSADPTNIIPEALPNELIKFPVLTAFKQYSGTDNLGDGLTYIMKNGKKTMVKQERINGELVSRPLSIAEHVSETAKGAMKSFKGENAKQDTLRYHDLQHLMTFFNDILIENEMLTINGSQYDARAVLESVKTRFKEFKYARGDKGTAHVAEVNFFDGDGNFLFPDVEALIEYRIIRYFRTAGEKAHGNVDDSINKYKTYMRTALGLANITFKNNYRMSIFRFEEYAHKTLKSYVIQFMIKSKIAPEQKITDPKIPEEEKERLEKERLEKERLKKIELINSLYVSFFLSFTFLVSLGCARTIASAFQDFTPLVLPGCNRPLSIFLQTFINSYEPIKQSLHNLLKKMESLALALKETVQSLTKKTDLEMVAANPVKSAELDKNVIEALIRYNKKTLETKKAELTAAIKSLETKIGDDAGKDIVNKDDSVRLERLKTELSAIESGLTISQSDQELRTQLLKLNQTGFLSLLFKQVTGFLTSIVSPALWFKIFAFKSYYVEQQNIYGLMNLFDSLDSGILGTSVIDLETLKKMTKEKLKDAESKGFWKYLNRKTEKLGNALNPINQLDGWLESKTPGLGVGYQEYDKSSTADIGEDKKFAETLHVAFSRAGARFTMSYEFRIMDVLTLGGKHLVSLYHPLYALTKVSDNVFKYLDPNYKMPPDLAQSYIVPDKLANKHTPPVSSTAQQLVSDAMSNILQPATSTPAEQKAPTSAEQKAPTPALPPVASTSTTGPPVASTSDGQTVAPTSAVPPVASTSAVPTVASTSTTGQPPSDGPPVASTPNPLIESGIERKGGRVNPYQKKKSLKISTQHCVAKESYRKKNRLHHI
jgi:hypothetical protein